MKEKEISIKYEIKFMMGQKLHFHYFSEKNDVNAKVRAKKFIEEGWEEYEKDGSKKPTDFQLFREISLK